MAINSKEKKDKNLNKKSKNNSKNFFKKNKKKISEISTKKIKKEEVKLIEDSSIKKIFKTIENKKTFPIILEYYDLPYRYNKTTVKFLAQDPHTLFIYWEISDKDKQDLIQKYGNNFFNSTLPVLILADLKNNKTYEIQINDFANNWYIHVNESHQKYQITLARKFKEIQIQKPTPKTSQNYIPIVKSNILITPNDHILFFKPNEKLEFKNILTNRITNKIISQENNKQITMIYKNYDNTINKQTSEFDYQNPTSEN